MRRGQQTACAAYVFTPGSGQTDEQGVWWGPLSPDEAAQVLAAVERDVYPVTLPDVPWAAALALPGGQVRVACHPMLDAGVFATQLPAGAVAVGLVLRGVHEASGAASWLNASWLGAYYAGHADGHNSPLTGVIRIPPGETATISTDGSIRRTVWCGPPVWAERPQLRGPQAQQAYLAAFDDVTEALAARAGPLTATVSGGLDSTFVAAALARLDRVEPVTALVYAPIPGAGAHNPHYVVDDLPWAHQMAYHYPGVFAFETVTNDALVHPLDSAARRFEATWWPVFGVANSVWTQRVEQRAVERGSELIFGGFHGNASFSWYHRHASAYCIDRRQWADLYRIAEQPNADLRRRLTAFRRHALAPLRHHSRGQGLSDHQRYLDFLAGRLNTHHGHPHGLELLRADPFRSRAILTLAAQIHPSEWRRQLSTGQVGPGDRAFARRLGAGRVPEPIRLRAARGLQSSDAWRWVYTSRERINDEIAAIAAIPIAGDLIDVPRLRSLISDWRWGDLDSPPTHANLASVLRDLAFADYCRTMPTKLG